MDLPDGFKKFTLVEEVLHTSKFPLQRPIITDMERFKSVFCKCLNINFSDIIKERVHEFGWHRKLFLFILSRYSKIETKYIAYESRRSIAYVCETINKTNKLVNTYTTNVRLISEIKFYEYWTKIIINDYTNKNIVSE